MVFSFSAEKMSRVLLIFLLLCALLLSTTSTSDIYSITFNDIEGNDVSMEDYRGKASSLCHRYYYLYYLWVCDIILSLLRSLSIIVCDVTRVLEPMQSLGWLLYLCLKAQFFSFSVHAKTLVVSIQ